MSPDLPWVVVGCGRVGRTLVLAARRAGIDVRACWSRGDGPIEDVVRQCEGAAVFLTVTDGALDEVARTVAPLEKAALAVHCSGSLSSDVLRDAGILAPVGSVHPLLSIAQPDQAVGRLGEAAWTIEGDPQVLTWARAWLGRLGATPTTIEPQHKALYHASAVTSAGLVVALLDAAFEMAAAAGIDREAAVGMLVPLARSALENLETMDPTDALTGPVARGDEDVIAMHRRALARLDDHNLRDIYDALTNRARRLAGVPTSSD